MSKNLKTLLCCVLSLVFVASTIVGVFADSNNLLAKEAESLTNEDVTAEDVSVEETTTEEVSEEATEEDSTEAPEVHEHDYVAVETAATCTEDGVIVYTCACGDSYEEVIPATGHTLVWEVVKAADVGVEGLKQLVCTVCDAVLDEEVIPAIEEESSEEVSDEATTEPTTVPVTDPTTEPTTVPVTDPTTEPTTDAPVSYRLGDVNFDGEITAADARLALRIAAQLEPDATDVQRFVADVTGDGKVEAKDARRILRVSAQLDKEEDFGKDINF